MRRGIRSVQFTTGNIYYIKVKHWAYFASVRVNTNNGDTYIISCKENYKDWHTNEMMQMVILHELGHLNQHFNNHFVNELFATFVGWYKYSKFAPLVNWKSPFKLTYKIFKYMLNKNYR